MKSKMLPYFLLQSSLVLSPLALASSPFWQGLSQTQSNTDYDYLAQCKRDCDDPKQADIYNFWYNSQIGVSEADIDLTYNAQNQVAARFLAQSTFGPTAQAINELGSAINQQGEYAALNTWINSQIEQPQSHLQDVVSNHIRRSTVLGWWQHSLTAPDQLRQRVAFSLSQIQTLSLKGTLRKDGAAADYYDMLAKNAFGNFRTLLHDVTYHIAMGVYLDNVRNSKATENTQPNENYARELMQLFSIGTEMLNLDGSIQTDGQGVAIPSYTEQDIETLAKALTGLRRAGKWEGELTAKKRLHDFSTKTLFAGQPFEAHFKASTVEQDINYALDAIFNHPNVAPFMAKRLIQHLVTSNPSSDYIARVAAKFNDNGLQVRGDMAAVIKAVLLDDEAINPHPDSHGRLKSPVERISNLYRALSNDPAPKSIKQVSQIQKPLYADSVFSFYKSSDRPTGDIQDAGLVAPEFTLATDHNLTLINNALHQITLAHKVSKKALSKNLITRFSLTKEKQLAVSDPSALIDRYNLLLMQGGMSANIKAKILAFITQLPSDDGGEQRARKALYLVMTSAQQAVLK